MNPLSAEEVQAMRRQLDALDAFPGERERRAGQKWLTTPEYERVVTALETLTPALAAARAEVRDLRSQTSRMGLARVSLKSDLERAEALIVALEADVRATGEARAAALREAAEARESVAPLQAEIARLKLLAEERRAWLEASERLASERLTKIEVLEAELENERAASESRGAWLDAAHRSIGDEQAEVERLRAEVVALEEWANALETGWTLDKRDYAGRLDATAAERETLKEQLAQLEAVTAERDALKARIAAFVAPMEIGATAGLPTQILVTTLEPAPEPPKPKRTRKKKVEESESG